MSLLSRYSALLFMVAALLCGIFGFSGAVHAEQVSLKGWGWSSNIGHVSFGSESPGAGGGFPYSVKLDTVTGDITGYAWSSSIGWLSFELNDVAPCPTLAEDGGNKQARVENIEFNGTRQVLGWARFINGDGNAANPYTGEWDGCVHLSSGANPIGKHNTGIADGTRGVTLIKEGANDKFVGYAWGGEVVGWLDFAPFLEKQGGCSGSGCNPPCPVGTNCGPVGDTCASLATCPGGGGSVTVELFAEGTPDGLVRATDSATFPVTLSWKITGVPSTCMASANPINSTWENTPSTQLAVTGALSSPLNLAVPGVYTFRLTCDGNADTVIVTLTRNTIPEEDPLDVICEVSDGSGGFTTSLRNVEVNTPVTYRARVTGGDSTYTYTWNGSGFLSTGFVKTGRPAIDTIQRTYGTTGLKNITVQVVDANNLLATGGCSLDPIINVVPKDIEVVPD